MRAGFLLFPFSPSDQAAIEASSITTADVGYAAAPVHGAPYPQALRLGFRLAGSAAPQVRPMLPGKLRFIPDPAAPGTTPAPGDVQFTAAAYAGWRTVGSLRLDVDQTAVQALEQLATGLEVVPNVLWYGPVRISQEFLFDTLRGGLRRERIGGTPSIGPTDARWPTHAVAAFLAGRYEPTVRAGASAAADDRIAHPMPLAHPTGTDNSVSLIVTAACRRKPKDAPSARLDQLSAGVDTDDPAHVANGAVPARHLYRTVRQHLTDAAAGAAVPDAVLATDGSAPTYHAIRCTRTWRPVEDCSAHFPQQRITVSDPAGNLLAAQRLPAHGVFYWAYPADAPVRHVRVSFGGTMRWIDGATTDVWQQPAGVAALAYDLDATPRPHVQLRLTMSEAMLVEPADTPGGARCTYLSMRRSARALVDNRICGGRLNHGRGSTNEETRQLIDDAWAGLPGSSEHVRQNRPLPNLEPGVGAPRLIPILRSFFPGTVPAQTVGGSTHRTVAYDGGEMAYRLWQSIGGEFTGNGTKRNFPRNAVGRGGPGAAVALGLAAYHVDPARRTGEGDGAYFDRIVGEMFAGLRPGAPLQFWASDGDFEDFKTCQDTGVSPSFPFGHSPVFVGYETTVTGEVTGLRIIDQFGQSVCGVDGGPGSRQITWGGGGQEIWIAANWEE